MLQVRPKGANAADLRDGYDADGSATRVGKIGFYLRPAFVARDPPRGATEISCGA